MVELQILPVFGGVDSGAHLALADMEVGVGVPVAVANAPDAHIVGDRGAPHVLREAVRDFVRLAVAVGVLLLKGLQNLIVLV